MSKELRNKFIVLVVLLAVIFATGTTGFWLIEGGDRGMKPFEAFYMTVITVTTIGFGEIPGALSTPGRILAIILAFGGMGTMLYGVSTVTAFLVEGQLRDMIRRRKMEKRIKKLHDHHIVCGSGLIAHYIASELRRTLHPFVVVDRNDVRLRELAGADHAFNYVVGDVADDEVLINCGVERAAGLLSALESDQDNLFTVITARRLNPNMRIVSLAVAEGTKAKLQYAGADGVVSPNFIGSMRMVSEMIRPAAVNFLDVMLKDRDRNWRIEEATLGQGSPLAGHELGKAMLKERSGALVLAIRQAGESDYVYNPTRSTILHPGDILVVLGSIDQITNLKSLAAAK